MRHPDPDDARYVRITLTKPGRALAQRLEDDLVRERSAVLAELSEKEREAVVRALEKLSDIVGSGISTDGGCSVRP